MGSEMCIRDRRISDWVQFLTLAAIIDAVHPQLVTATSIEVDEEVNVMSLFNTNILASSERFQTTKQSRRKIFYDLAGRLLAEELCPVRSVKK